MRINKYSLYVWIWMSTTVLYAQTTVCYKKNWTQPSKIESVSLDGGVCQGKESLIQMKQKGWFIKDIQIKPSNKGLDYTYQLTTINPIKPVAKSKRPVSLNLKEQSFVLKEVESSTAVISQGDLMIGQSGIIEHRYDNGHRIIVASAYVIESNSVSSKVKFLPFLDLQQNAIPTSNRHVEEGDRLILNYLYDSSLLIAPNAQSFKLARTLFKDQTFIHSDIFGAYLKFIHRPIPTKNIIQTFALSQNMGTIFVVLEGYVYIVDARTFTVLDKKRIPTINRKTQMPFYTRVEKIESSLLTQDYTKWIDWAKRYFVADQKSEEEILYGSESSSKNSESTLNYNEYYKKLLGV